MKQVHKKIVSLVLMVALVATLSVSVFASGATSPTVKREQAVAIAQKELPEGILLSVDYEWDDGFYLYEMEWLNSDNYEYDIEVRASNGKVVKFRRDDYRKNADSYRNAGISHEKAIEIAAGNQKNLRFDESKLQLTTHGLYYKVTFYSSQGQKLQAVLNAADGTLISSTDNYLGTPTTKEGTSVTLEEAKQIALDHVGGGRITKARQDFDDGRLEYEIEIRYNGLEYEIDIDATTGNIVKYDIDD